MAKCERGLGSVSYPVAVPASQRCLHYQLHFLLFDFEKKWVQSLHLLILTTMCTFFALFWKVADHREGGRLSITFVSLFWIKQKQHKVLPYSEKIIDRKKKVELPGKILKRSGILLWSIIVLYEYGTSLRFLLGGFLNAQSSFFHRKISFVFHTPWLLLRLATFGRRCLNASIILPSFLYSTSVPEEASFSVVYPKKIFFWGGCPFFAAFFSARHAA